MTPGSALRTVKLLHTGAWACFAGCILAIPVLGFIRRYEAALALIGIVLAEVIILVVNGLRCPLTAVAARYTDDRRDNFDIYLPLWIARNNKFIFGLLFLLGALYVAVRWLGKA